MSEPDPNEAPIRLDYAKPEPSRWPAAIARLFERLAILFWMGFAAVVFPIPYGIWYVGSRPQWVIALERGAFSVGHSDGSRQLLHFDTRTVWVAKSAVVLIVWWAILRWFRRRKRTPVAPA